MLTTLRNAAVLAIGAGIAAASLGAVEAGSAPGPLRCEITATKAGAMTTLAGVVHADRPLAGTYSFRVASTGSAGRTDISQGGEFSAAPGRAETLGQVMLGGGSTLNASLEVTSGGRTWRCSERVGAI